ncbi:ead/Ea22-like family protein [Escherichia coli]|uniref:ead/Ea22-like family protein n=1 Tax=Escherichia coli TaxID=562 RepID=UPI00191C7474
MTQINYQALREAAEKATALNLDTAQVKRGNDGYLECPCCEGAGYVEEESDFCNIDGVALGVQFYGIGEHYGLAESYLRAANPATVLALLDELDKWQQESSAWQAVAEKQLALAADAEKRIAELEERKVVPDEMTPKQASRSYCGEVRGYRDGWNACRAAMLQGA